MMIQVLSLVLIACSMEFLDGLSTPSMSPAVHESKNISGVSAFLNIWEHSISTDKIVGLERSPDPKTLIIPGDLSMINLVPQDSFHPLYMADTEYENLRKGFILDHLVPEAVSENVIRKGVELISISGKKIILVQNPVGVLEANGIPVISIRHLPEATTMLILDKPLFNYGQKVRDAFRKIHNIDTQEATGPPLDLNYPPRGPVPQEIKFPDQPEFQPQPPSFPNFFGREILEQEPEIQPPALLEISEKDALEPKPPAAPLP